MCDSPVWGGGAVHVVIPVADSEFLVEARLVAAHVGNPATVLITHVEYLGKENVTFIHKTVSDLETSQLQPEQFYTAPDLTNQRAAFTLSSNQSCHRVQVIQCHL